MRRTLRPWWPPRAPLATPLVQAGSGSLVAAVVTALAAVPVLPLWARVLCGALAGLGVAVAVRRWVPTPMAFGSGAERLPVAEPRVMRLMIETLEAVVQEQSAALAELEQRLGEADEAEQRRRVEAQAREAAERGRRETVVSALGHLQGPTAEARIEAAVRRLGVAHGFGRPSLGALAPAGSSASLAPARVQPAAEETAVVLPVPLPPPPAVEARRRLFRRAA